jgi:hypothetical protein
MIDFQDYLYFWGAAAVVFYGCKLVIEIYKDLRAKYIVWAWKRNKR